ncbi:hypothetical protein LguiA_034950 [Lonicera macranthoides]
MFVWPWIGIVVNLSTELKDGRYIRESGSKLRDQLAKRGFIPTRVNPLWNYQGHSGTALVEFNKDWSGFTNAMSFEKAYEVDHHGKKDWLVSEEHNLDLYGWVARANDYNSDGIIGKNLYKIRDIRTISNIMADEDRRTNKFVSNLINVIEEKKKHFVEMENKLKETSIKLSMLIKEKDKLHQAYNEVEMRRIQSSAREHFQKIFNDHEKIKLQLERQRRELEVRGKELEKCEIETKNESQKLYEEIEKNATINSSLELVANEQKKADENIMKLADEQKREKEDLHKKIIGLEKKLDAKQAVELKIKQLKGTLNVMKHVGEGDDGDLEVLKKMEDIHKI